MRLLIVQDNITFLKDYPGATRCKQWPSPSLQWGHRSLFNFSGSKYKTKPSCIPGNCKMFNIVTICNSTPRCLLSRNKNINPLVYGIHSSTIHIAKKWKPPQCPSTGEEIFLKSDMSKEYYLAMKRNEALMHAKTWWTSSERNQIQKTTYYVKCPE